MFQHKTVLVLGAGAGQEIKMGLGADLIADIARGVNIVYEMGVRRTSGKESIDYALQNYARKHELDPNQLLAAGRNIARGVELAGSIDSYIHNHRTNNAIKIAGKIGIADCILAYEKNSDLFVDTTKYPRRYKTPEKVKASWLHRFMQLVGDNFVAGESLTKIFENLTVVNFNYDRCFEHFMWRSLQDRFALTEMQAVELMNSLNIFHPYGRIAPLPWQDRGGLEFGGDPHGNLPDLASISENIRTYNEEVTAKEEIKKIHEAIAKSRRIVFLGFHFHDQNIELISPANAPKISGKEAYATVLDRRLPEQNRIRTQISHFMATSGTSLEIFLEDAGCRDFFEIWGTTLVH